MHKNKVNNKVYIGQTKLETKDRWKEGKGYKKCSYFYKAIQKYGWDGFEHIILKNNLTLEEANYWESYYISKCKSNNKNFGYNLTSGGEGYQVNEEARENMRLAQKKYFNTHTISEETRRKMSVSQKKRWEEPAFREKMSNIRKEIWKREEYKNYQSESRKGELNPSARKVRCIEEPNKIFGTVTEASQWCNNGSSSLRSKISLQARGERKSCGKHPITGVPLHWEYL